jgi:diaminohydroxyphosphoribosylaminopyrimidine deaminase/5-amino-6-(5-phosphoribosylamino)uracil reductase
VPTDGQAAHDEERMARASALAAGVRRRTAPNPWVGCIVDRAGVVVGEGATEPPGGPHAEVLALRAAGERAAGATVYVTLEPCAHHGRTPPCADALIQAGIRRVVVALADPDARVAGEGIARLRAAGLTVDVGVGAAAVGLQLAPYLHHRRTGRASCVVKTAVSVDGRSGAADGSSQWITGEAARADAHGLRADSQAIVVGAGTALADRPALTVRHADPLPAHPPLRVVLDSTGRVAATGALFDDGAPTMVITTHAAPSAALDAWRGAGAKVEVVDAVDGRVDLAGALSVLGAHGVLQAMVEGGPVLHGALLGAGLVDRYVVYLGGTLLGERARPAFVWPGPGSIIAAPRLRLVGTRVLGDDVRLDYVPAPEAG